MLSKREVNNMVSLWTGKENCEEFPCFYHYKKQGG